jgi:hypothetical protein
VGGGGKDPSPIINTSSGHNSFNHFVYFDSTRIEWIQQILALGDQQDTEIRVPGYSTNWKHQLVALQASASTASPSGRDTTIMKRGRK